jgi:very-short-patch-repair endonuclease
MTSDQQMKWQSSLRLWEKLKPLARERRHEPTPAENQLWQHLRSRQIQGAKFRRQHTIDKFIADFYCVEAHLLIEVDGPIHGYTQEDAIRQEYLESLGIKVLRFTNDEVFSAIESVIQRIAGALNTVILS